MRRHLVMGLLALVTVSAWAGAGTPGREASQPGSQWKLVWSDEFNEPGLPNPAKWDYETGFIRNVDNQKYFTFRNEGAGADVWPFDKDQYLILNLAIGGSWGGQKGIDDSIFPQRYCIDYVRVYTQNTQAAAANTVDGGQSP